MEQQRKDNIDYILSNLAHKIRREILRLIHKKPGITYSEILRTTQLDTGTLNYHLAKLSEFYKRENGGYYLTKEGEIAIDILNMIRKKIKLGSMQPSFSEKLRNYLPPLNSIYLFLIVLFRPKYVATKIKTIGYEKFYSIAIVFLFLTIFDIDVISIVRGVIVLLVFLFFIRYNIYVLWEMRLRMSYITLYLSIASVPLLITNIIRVSIKLLGVMPLEFYSNFLYVLLFIIIPLFWSFILLVKLIAYGMNLTPSRSFILIFTSVMFTAFILIPVFIIFSLL
ncbi:MAG: DUF7347 domain-containing protein [Candidatus Asgardarchaeia archaeon]